MIRVVRFVCYLIIGLLLRLHTGNFEEHARAIGLFYCARGSTIDVAHAITIFTALDVFLVVLANNFIVLRLQNQMKLNSYF